MLPLEHGPTGDYRIRQDRDHEKLCADLDHNLVWTGRPGRAETLSKAVRDCLPESHRAPCHPGVWPLSHSIEHTALCFVLRFA